MVFVMLSNDVATFLSLSRKKKFPLVASHERVKFDLIPKDGPGVTSLKRTFTFL